MKKVILLTLVLMLAMSSVAYGANPLDHFRCILTDQIVDDIDTSGFVNVNYDKENDFYKFVVQTKGLTPGETYYVEFQIYYMIVAYTIPLDKNGKFIISTEGYPSTTWLFKQVFSEETTVNIRINSYFTGTLELSGDLEPIGSKRVK